MTTPPRLLAYVRLPRRSLLYRAVHVPEDDDGDLIVVERQTTDALGTLCWVDEPNPDVEQAVIRRALIGGEGVTRPEEEPPGEGGLLNLWRQLLNWCEIHGVSRPTDLDVRIRDAEGFSVPLRDAESWGHVHVDSATFERLAGDRAIRADPPDEEGVARAAVVIDGVRVVALVRVQRLEVTCAS